MKKNNHEKIDLLRMNIEGAEYPILEQMLRDDYITKIDQLNIEFHYRFKKELPKLTTDIINRIKEKGYSIVSITDNHNAFLFIKNELL